MLPSSREVTATGSGWQKYADAEATFGRIVPGKTTAAELKALNLDPSTNPTVTRLQSWQVRDRFIPNKLVTLADLDDGVRACVTAGPACTAYEVNFASSQTKRTGNPALDLIKVHRERQTSGFRFNGLILVKEGVVVYTLTAGQPRIVQLDEMHDVLGPVQAVSSKLRLDEAVTNALAGNKPNSQPASPDAPAMGISALRR